MHSLDLENDLILIHINSRGAELSNLYHKGLKKSYLWNGDPTYWSRKAPILFPIVGKLKNDRYTYQNKNYSLPQHGFARDLDFILIKKTDFSLTFECTSTLQTKAIYPFDWKLRITYTLEADILIVKSTVINTSEIKPLLFSIGFHPAFKIPINESELLQDYKIMFNKDIDAERWPINCGLIESQTYKSIVKNEILLNESTFIKDALVFKNLKSDEVSIMSSKSPNGITMKFEGFPYFAIWSKPGASFICLEPWYGIADNVYHQGDLETKEGIIHLNPNEDFDCGYEIRLL